MPYERPDWIAKLRVQMDRLAAFGSAHAADPIDAASGLTKDDIASVLANLDSLLQPLDHPEFVPGDPSDFPGDIPPSPRPLDGLPPSE